MILQRPDHDRIDEPQTQAFVVATHRYAMEVIREKRDKSPSGWRPPLIFSLEQFLRMFVDSGDSVKRILSDEESFFILRQIIMQKKKDFISLFSGGGEPFPNHIQSALRVIRELKGVGIGHERLDTLKEESEEGILLRRLYICYDEFLKRRRFLDKADIPSKALENLSVRSIESAFKGVESLIFDGIDLYPPALIEFIEKIARFIPKVMVFLEYEDQREPLFRHIEASYRNLSSRACRVFVIEEESEPGSKGDFLKSLYKELDEENSGVSGVADFMSVFSLPDRLREVKFIARMIKRLIAEKSRDLRLRDICVCFPALEVYAPLAREVFDSYRVPFEISLGLSLSQSPVIRAIDQLFTLIESDFERSALTRFLINPYFSFDELTSDGKAPSSESMLKHIRSIRVNKGATAWIDSLKRVRESLSQKVSLMEGGEASIEEDSSRQEVLQETRNALEELKKTITILENLNETLPPAGEERPFSFYSRSIKESVDKLGVRKNLLIPPYEGGGFALFRRDVRAVGRLFEIMDHLDILSDTLENRQVPFSEYIRELRSVLNRASIHPEDGETDAVRIMGRLEPRLFSFKYFFLGGFLEGEFPHAPSPFLFLRANERKRLGLKSSREALSADRFLFYHFLRQTRERFIITFPFQKDETPLPPSPLLDEILRISDLSAREAECDENVYSERELRIKLAIEASSGGRFAEWKEIYESYAAREAQDCPGERCLQMLEATGENKISDVLIPRDHPILKKSVFSTSQLEEYGRCPFHYYARRLLRLKEPEEMEEEISPLERGEMIHRALFRFYRQRAKSGAIPIQNEEEAKSAEIILIELAAEEMARQPYQDIFWEAEKERLLGGKSPLERPGLLRIFIQNELRFFQGADPGYVPEFFEVAFGSVPGTASERDPLSSKTPYRIDHPGGAINLRGKVDRVEVCGEYFSVVDYKTGASLSSVHDIEDGTSLQLPVYLLAIREKLKSVYRKNYIPAGGLFYQINREDRVKRDSQIILKSQRKPLLGSERKRTFCENEEEMERILELAKMRVKDHVTGIRSGHFPLSGLKPEKALCGSCAFRLSCRRVIKKMFCGR